MCLWNTTVGSTPWMQLLVFWVCGTELTRGEDTWLPRHGMGMLWPLFPAYSWALLWVVVASPTWRRFTMELLDVMFSSTRSPPASGGSCYNIFWSIFGRNLVPMVFLPALIFQLDLAWAQGCVSIPTCASGIRALHALGHPIPNGACESFHQQSNIQPCRHIPRGKNSKTRLENIWENKISGARWGRGSQFCESRLQP